MLDDPKLELNFQIFSHILKIENLLTAVLAILEIQEERAQLTNPIAIKDYDKKMDLIIRIMNSELN